MEHVTKDGHDFGAEFGFGLDLVLDALAERVDPSSRSGRTAS
jgi:hypothetical protein